MSRETAPVHDLLRQAVVRGASDVHIVPGHPPTLRIQGELASAGGDALSPAQATTMIEAVLPPGGAERLAERRNIDFAFTVDGGGGGSSGGAGPPRDAGGGGMQRFRASVFYARGELGACFRHIPTRIPELSELGFPAELADRIAPLTSGMVLVTGITGAGKTTSLAALVQRFNAAGGHRIITIEEPIEYLFDRAPGSVISQREVGVDVSSFYEGLRSGLRQDPDLVLVGEVRDRETAQLAISAAETGHVIFATLHSPDARGAITRLIDLFPPEQQPEVRTQLSMSLRFVVAQHLLPGRERGARRVLACEVLATNFAVRAAIRTGKIESIDSAIQSGRRDGMWSMDAHIKQLLGEGRIDATTARQYAKDPSEVAPGGGFA